MIFNLHRAKKISVWFLVVLLLGLTTPRGAQAFIVLNEILADPPTGIAGDANGDGVGSSTDDEFIELLNYGSTDVDLSGWYLNDALKSRHVFHPGTVLLADQYWVVFGGGTPVLPGVNYQLASTGTLSLNNTSEDVFLYNNRNQLIDHVSYGAEGGKNQSLARYPEGSGSEFVLHSTIPEAQGKLFSPGKSADGKLELLATVPELSGYWYSLLVAIGFLFRNKFRNKFC